jgi:FSR family fosmidomycin resistance protein-like MFS transporter
MIRRLIGKVNGPLLPLNILHVFNDGFTASLLLLLPFIAASQGLNLAQVGLLGTVLEAAGILLALPAAYFAARFGGVRVLLAAAAIYAGAFLATGATGTYFALIPIFVLAGVGFGVFHPIAFSLIAHWTPKERRGRVLGDFTAIGDLGRIGIAAALSFFAVAIGWRQTAALYGAVAIIVALVVYRFMAGRDGGQAATESSEKPKTPVPWSQMLHNQRLVLTLVAAAFDGFASSSLFVFLPFLLLTRSVTPALLGTFTATFFIGTFLGKTLLGRFVDRLGGVRVLIISEVLMAVFIYLLSAATWLPVIVVCAVILGVFTKGTVPVLIAMIAESVEHHGDYAKAYSIESTTSNIAKTIAPLALGIVSVRLGIVSAFQVMAVAALLAAGPGVWIYLTNRRALREKS